MGFISSKVYLGKGLRAYSCGFAALPYKDVSSVESKNRYIKGFVHTKQNLFFDSIDCQNITLAQYILLLPSYKLIDTRNND